MINERKMRDWKCRTKWQGVKMQEQKCGSLNVSTNVGRITLHEHQAIKTLMFTVIRPRNYGWLWTVRKWTIWIIEKCAFYAFAVTRSTSDCAESMTNAATRIQPVHFMVDITEPLMSIQYQTRKLSQNQHCTVLQIVIKY